MNNTTQLLAVLGQSLYLRDAVYSTIEALAFIEREWGMCPPITSIETTENGRTMIVKWSWAGGASYVLWTHLPRRHFIQYHKNVGGLQEEVEFPTPPQVARLLAKHIAHIAEYAWDYR